jgi:DNA sulfur modification protein DndC
MVRELLDIECRFSTMSRRAGLYDALEVAFKRGFFSSPEDATERARKRQRAITQARAGTYEEPAVSESGSETGDRPKESGS